MKPIILTVLLVLCCIGFLFAENKLTLFVLAVCAGAIIGKFAK